MRQRRLFHKFFLALISASLLLIAGWLPFAGHVPLAAASAFVVGSDPVDGSTISTLPSIVRIYFNAPVASLSQAEIYAFPPGGSANGELVNARHSIINTTNTRELDTPLLAASKLPEGSYEVRWTAVSLTDGRTTNGLIGFNLSQSSSGLAGTPTLGPSTSNNFPQLDLQGILSVAWDWLVLLALLFWVGILVTDLFIIPRSSPEVFQLLSRRHSRSLQAFCLGALLAGEVVNVILRATSFTQMLGQGGIDPDVLTTLIFSTSYGYFWLTRVVLLLLALTLLWWFRYRTSQPQDVASRPATSKRLGQLRQQARMEASAELPAITRSLPVPARSQARVTGAVVTNASPARGNTSSLPRPNGDAEAHELSLRELSPWALVSWLTLASLLILTLALSNDVIQLVPLPISAGIFLWLTLAAQAIWFGCLAYLGITVFPILPVSDPDHHAEILVNILKRATPFVLFAIGVLLVGEVFLSEATIHASSQLIDTPYGVALLFQLSLLVLALLFTCYLLFFLLPHLQRQTVLLPVVDAELPARRTRKFALSRTTAVVRRVLHALTGLAAVALVCMALMNFFAPPVVFPAVNYAALVNQSSTGNGASSASQTQRAGNLSVTLQVLPGRVGVANTIILSVSNAQGKAVTNATVKLRLDMEIMNMGTTSATAQESNTVYIATLKAGQGFTMAGSWTVQVEIDQPGQQPVQLSFQVMAQ